MRLVVVPNLRGTSRQGVWVVLAVLVAAALAASLLLLMMVASPARADTTFTVKSKADTDGMTCGPSDCTLRQAINAANAAPGNDTIVFALGPTATITLGSTLPTITDASGLTIDGQSASITISGNEQVRVFEVVAGAELALSKLTVANGSAGLGGGIKNEGGTLKVTDSTFSDNNAVGTGSDPVSCENACLGGGIQNDGGTLTVIRSTFSGNKSDAIGGGISNVNGGTLKIINSTFSGNGAGFVGGAINNGGKLEVTYSTFSDNVGGGINNANAAGVTLTLSNTILANSTGGNIREVCAGGTCQGKIIDGGYNISDDDSTSEFFTDQTSKSNTEPGLAGGLANNGGPTQTIALLEGSPALNAIPKAQNGCGTEITTDQRGVTRPQFAACDIGAYELAAQASPAPPDKDKKDKKDKKQHNNNKGGGGGGGGGISQGSSQG